MDSFEINKILGALLGAVFILFSVNLLSNTIFASPAPQKPGFAIEAAEPSEGAGGAASGPAAVESALPLLASADIAAGQATFKKCQTCHDGTKGGPNKTGPNLWGVVERPVASHEGFSYSAAMKEFSKGGSEKWTFEHLDPFLTSPKDYVKGTAMGFAGLKKTAERANLIAFLHTLSDNPVPLPAAGTADKAAQAGGKAAPAAAEKPAGGTAAAPANGGNGAAPAKAGTAAAPAKAGTAAAPASGGTTAPSSAAPAQPAPANNGNSAAPSPASGGSAPAPATGGNAAAPAKAGTAAAPASGGNAQPAGAAPGAGAKPANGSSGDAAARPTTTAQPEPDSTPKN